MEQCTERTMGPEDLLHVVSAVSGGLAADHSFLSGIVDTGLWRAEKPLKT